MAIFVSEDPKKGTSTFRHTWRAEIFAEFGQDPQLKVHRAQIVCDTDTGELLNSKKDRVVTRDLSDLPDGQRQTVMQFFELLDVLEAEDVVKEQEEIKN